MKDSLLRDRIVLEIQSQPTEKRLLQDRKLTPKKRTDMCRSFEAVSSQLKNIANDTSLIENVKAVGQRYKKSPKNRPTNPPKKQTTAGILCNYCGTEHPPIKEQCPVWGKSCRSCGVRNHFANVCRKAQKTDLHAMNELASENTDDVGDYVEYVTSVTLVHDEIHQVSVTNISPFVTEIYAELIVKDEPVKFQLNCGATINILPEKDAQSCDLKSTTKRLRMWNGSEVIPLQTTRVIVRNPQNQKVLH